MPLDLAVPHSGIGPTDTLACMPSDVWARSFIAAKEGRQSVCPSMETGEINYVPPHNEIVSIMY